MYVDLPGVECVKRIVLQELEDDRMLLVWSSTRVEEEPHMRRSSDGVWIRCLSFDAYSKACLAPQFTPQHTLTLAPYAEFMCSTTTQDQGYTPSRTQTDLRRMYRFQVTLCSGADVLQKPSVNETMTVYIEFPHSWSVYCDSTHDIDTQGGRSAVYTWLEIVVAGILLALMMAERCQCYSTPRRRLQAS